MVNLLNIISLSLTFSLCVHSLLFEFIILLPFSKPYDIIILNSFIRFQLALTSALENIVTSTFPRINVYGVISFGKRFSGRNAGPPSIVYLGSSEKVFFFDMQFTNFNISYIILQ